MAQFIKSEWDGFEAQHRYEDLILFRDALNEWRPQVVVELGTAKGGMAVFFAQSVRVWGGKVISVDKELDTDLQHRLNESGYGDGLISLLGGDCLHPEVGTLHLIRTRLQQFRRRPLLYCDNGNKMLELRTWVPVLPRVALVGVHDYGTEVNAEEAEAYMRQQGFAPYWHAQFEALAHPEWYPQSLTRLWQREALPEKRSTERSR